MRKFGLYIALAAAITLPGLVLQFVGVYTAPLLDTFIFGIAILGAGFMLSWAAEAAEQHVSQGLAIAGLALVTVLPEYAVDIYYTLQAGQHPDSQYVQFAAANMTGANRLLIGTAWPLIVLLFWWRSGKREVELRADNRAEVAFLALASLYAFVIVLKGTLELLDTVVLIGIFAAYLWRVSKLPKGKGGADADDDDDDVEVGPAAALTLLPKRQQYVIIAVLVVVAALAILVVAEPFAESLIKSGEQLGIDKFFLIQWLAPLAGEAPEIVITVLFTLSRRPTVALGALISDKINQWTLLVGMIPLFYSLGSGQWAVFPLDARQHEEFFLTAAQSLFAVALLLRLRFSLRSGLVVLTLFLVQFGLAFVFRDNEAMVISSLTYMAWLYIALAVAVILWNRNYLVGYIKVGLLGQPAAIHGSPVEEGQVKVTD